MAKVAHLKRAPLPNEEMVKQLKVTYTLMEMHEFSSIVTIDASLTGDTTYSSDLSKLHLGFCEDVYVS